MLGDRYALGEVIGRGGMADVYRATDVLLSREVAVKVLRDRAEDAHARDRFTAEARTLASLSHAGLVMILDAGIDAEQPYLVMGLVEGSTLAALCAEGPLDGSEAARIGAQVAAALSYVHAQGVIHRDVKPGNVLIGADGQVKLADFGIARLIGDTVRNTLTGQAIGTPAYLAPEQVRGQEITPAVDVYSLGLVLLEALTGERAYPGPPVEAAMARLSSRPSIPADLPPGWRSLLAAATATAPADRPDASTLAGRMLVLSEAPLTAELPLTEPIPVPVRHRWAAWLQARPSEQRWVAAAIAAMAILIGIAGFASEGAPTPTASADAAGQDQSPTTRSPKPRATPPPTTPSAPQTTEITQHAKPDKAQKPSKKKTKPGEKKPKKHGPKNKH